MLYLAKLLLVSTILGNASVFGSMNCEKQCTEKSEPFCVLNLHNNRQLTLRNDCWFEQALCYGVPLQKLHEGRCNGTSLTLCSDACPQSKELICALNLDTGAKVSFANQCILDNFNCHSQTTYEYLHEGNCTDDSKYHDRDCQRQCLRIYDPLCVYVVDAKEYRTFPHQCALENYVCNTQHYVDVLHNGKCERDKFPDIFYKRVCPIVCPREYNHVCAIKTSTGEHVTFQNACLIEKIAKCTSQDFVFHHKGPCKKRRRRNNVARNCEKRCLKITQPICAINLQKGEKRTFKNRCSLDKYVCRKNIPHRLLYEGRCRKDSPSRIKCLASCPTKREPICTSVLGEMVTVKNKCHLENLVNCRKYQYEYLHNGTCPDAQYRRKYSPQAAE